MSVFDDTAKINNKIKELKKTIKIVEKLTDAQKQCKVLLSSEVGVLQRQLKNAKSTEAIVINKSIKELQVWADGIKNFPDDEAKALNKILSSGTDVKHISRILLADDPITLLKKIEAAGNVTEFEKELRAAKLTGYADELKKANKMADVFSEFRPLAREFDNIALLIKEGKQLTKVLRVLSKIPVPILLLFSAGVLFTLRSVAFVSQRQNPS
jgi:hypothetical protein